MQSTQTTQINQNNQKEIIAIDGIPHAIYYIDNILYICEFNYSKEDPSLINFYKQFKLKFINALINNQIKDTLI